MEAGGYHLVIRRENGLQSLPTSPKNIFMPFVNVTMESALDTYSGKNEIGVLKIRRGEDG
jgi:chemotaxis response regulator CheB